MSTRASLDGAHALAPMEHVAAAPVRFRSRSPAPAQEAAAVVFASTNHVASLAETHASTPTSHVAAAVVSFHPEIRDVIAGYLRSHNNGIACVNRDWNVSWKDMMKELLRNPLVPVKAHPFQVNDKSGDIIARSSVCILPAAIVISAVEVVWIRQLRYAVSGNIISLEWDERFASLDIDLSVMDGYRSKGYLEIGIDSLLYLLQFAIHVPLSLLTLRFHEGICMVTKHIPPWNRNVSKLSGTWMAN